jgi:hypothetical protein
MPTQMTQQHTITLPTLNIILFFKNAWKAYKQAMIDAGEIQANTLYRK